MAQGRSFMAQGRCFMAQGRRFLGSTPPCSMIENWAALRLVLCYKNGQHSALF